MSEFQLVTPLGLQEKSMEQKKKSKFFSFWGGKGDLFLSLVSLHAFSLAPSVLDRQKWVYNRFRSYGNCELSV